MAALTLQVVSIDAAPVGQPTMHAFEATGGSIGRDETNLLALPDKHRRVSRLHATISFPGGVPTITNASTSLPLAVGEQQLDGGDSMPITQGALIEIGPYILQAHVGNTRTDTLPPQPPEPPAVRRDALPTVLPQAARTDAIATTPAANIDLLAADPLAHWPEASVGAAYVSLLATSEPVANQPPDQFSAGLSAFDFAVGSNAGTASDPLASLGMPPLAQPPIASAIPVDVDPFADLLAGIGAAPGAPPSNGFAVNPSSRPDAAQAGLSTDPMAAFGGSMSFTQGEPLSERTPLYGSGTAGAANGLLPDDFNAFHMPSSSSRNAADPLAGLMGSGAIADTSRVGAVSDGTPSIDSLFQTAGHDSSYASLLGLAPAARGGDGSIEGLIRSDTANDPMSLFDIAESAPRQSAQPMRNDSMEVGSAFAPPLARLAERQSHAPLHPNPSMVAALPINAFAAQPVPAAPAVAPHPLAQSTPAAPQRIAPSAPSVTSAPIAPASTDALSNAFLLGAGLAPSALPHGLTPEIMTIVGSLLRSATAGAVDMLAARAATKREVQASVTIISVQANNPLKFLPNADAALLQLLGKKMPGFMRADVAMRDAFDDLRAHEVGVIAGTRAALTEVLGKFDPAVLGDKLAKGSVLESLMPSARKAKLWDQYLERYLQIRREAEDDFQSIFGRAFVQAYERETARIKGESPTAGGE